MIKKMTSNSNRNKKKNNFNLIKKFDEYKI